ncbi:MAG: His-Xaa-Ser system radical SAM maturase HxsC [Phycisphaerae bacterium]|nr:His-Xaa-Ser system radical SAM maturase HxsC [Phycisphaerae bacterium]MDD5380566.1 His-Xaa-Ser system radical SAM maturase HxsC [Phycisphaerae bacterium]
MLKLCAHIKNKSDGIPVITRINENYSLPKSLRAKESLLIADKMESFPEGFLLYILKNGIQPANDCDYHKIINLPEELNYLKQGDIIEYSPKTGNLSVLYRKDSTSNVIFLTDDCNCNCIICPQPSPGVKKGCLLDTWSEAIPLMSMDTQNLGISGGEPSLYPDDLLKVILLCKNYLPNTAVDILSNGRMFNYMSLCREFLQIGHPSLLFGIPLYADLAYLHNFIVQSDSAFDQTIRGIYNLKRCDQHIEIRNVIIKQNYQRLPDWGHFIARNFPFVDHVAIMGLEPIGKAKLNIKDIWIDPVDYSHQLNDAVEELVSHNINVSIYNHQLCTIDRSLWSFSVHSISDWKNIYLKECKDCSQGETCGGFFASSTIWHSKHIRPL